MKSMGWMAAAVAGVLVQGMAWGAGATTAGGTRPNILLLLADDWGWTDLQTGATNEGNGNGYAQTPAINSLAVAGMSFTNMHTCPNCAPARASLMTGEYAVHNGVYNVGSLERGKGDLEPAKQRSQHILPESVTFAEVLKAAGYETCHVGKFHVSTHEEVTQADGFDVNYGGGKKGDGTPHGYMAVKEGDHYSFVAMGPEMDQFATPYTKEYVEKNLKPFANGNDPSGLVGTKKHLTDADADAAIDFLTKHLEGEKKGQPFFMNLAFNAVHAKVVARQDLLKKYEGIKSTDARHQSAGFAALIEQEDQAIARVLKFLDEKGLAENTLVIFTSDNGGSSVSTHNDPLRGYKGMFYEGGLRVPLIARWPGVVKAGAVSKTMVNMVDLYPTFVEVGGGKLPTPAEHVLDGISFVPVLKGEATESKREVTYYHFPGYLDTRAYPCSVMIKKLGDGKNYKLWYSYEDQHYELYNLTDDLSEKTDLLQGQVTEDAKKKAEGMRADLLAWIGETKPLMAKVKGSGEVVPLPIELERALAAGNKIKRGVAAGEGTGGD